MRVEWWLHDTIYWSKLTEISHSEPNACKFLKNPYNFRGSQDEMQNVTNHVTVLQMYDTTSLRRMRGKAVT